MYANRAGHYDWGIPLIIGALSATSNETPPEERRMVRIVCTSRELAGSAQVSRYMSFRTDERGDCIGIRGLYSRCANVW